MSNAVRARTCFSLLEERCAWLFEGYLCFNKSLNFARWQEFSIVQIKILGYIKNCATMVYGSWGTLGNWYTCATMVYGSWGTLGNWYTCATFNNLAIKAKEDFLTIDRLTVTNSPGPGIISLHMVPFKTGSICFYIHEKASGSLWNNLMKIFLAKNCLHYFASHDMNMLLVCEFGHK